MCWGRSGCLQGWRLSSLFCRIAARVRVGAKLGAIRGGPRRSCVDSGGIRGQLLSHAWTDLETHGHVLEIYGSGGWVFESPRARWRSPL
jgi:hypothetical protein